MQNDDVALLSISLAGYGQLVKMLMALSPHGIYFIKFSLLIHLKLSSVYQIKLNNKFNHGSTVLITPVVECLTQDQGSEGSSLTGITLFSP